MYRYRQPVQLPKGTVLHMRYTYDNSASNSRNPHNPPIRVRAGNRSEDEMAHLWLQVLPVHAGPGDPDPRLLIEEDEATKIVGDMKGEVTASWNDTVRASGVSESDAEIIRGAFVYPGFSL